MSKEFDNCDQCNQKYCRTCADPIACDECFKEVCNDCEMTFSTCELCGMILCPKCAGNHHHDEPEENAAA
jgi:hypothetical protein